LKTAQDRASAAAVNVTSARKEPPAPERGCVQARQRYFFTAEIAENGELLWALLSNSLV